MVEEKNDADKAKEALKDKLFKAVCIQWFLAVVAHTINLQSEAILIRNACGNDLGKAARVSSISNALAGVLGLLLNQIGGKLSDSLGRRPFYMLGPLAQLFTGLVCFTLPKSTLVLGTFKALKTMATTFSGTVIGSAAMREVFQGKELAVRSSKAGSIIGLGIMAGPLLEGFILKLAKPRSERVTYLGLAAVGILAAVLGHRCLPETLAKEHQKELDLSSTLRSANPFGFLQLYTHGSPAVKKLVTIISMQTMIDGKNISDLTQIWTREHLKLQMESIRNFIMGYGFASMMAGAKLTPFLLKKLSVSGFTTLTNLTNFVGFCMRGSVENMWVFFGALPLMLPGVNAASTTALATILNDHMISCGFGIGESTAWVSNLRVLVGAAATLIYGYFYAWCRKKGLNAGLTFSLAGALGAALPQLMFMLMVKRSELESRAAVQKA